MIKIIVVSFSDENMFKRVNRMITWNKEYNMQLNSVVVERIDHLLMTNPQLPILVKRRGFLDKSRCKVLIKYANPFSR